MTTNIHLDLETYSEADLKKVGLYRYATDPSSEILMMAYAIGGQGVKIVDTYMDIQATIRTLYGLADEDTLFWAHNAAFERIMLREVLGIDIPIERWRCTQALGYMFAFAGGLGDMVKALDAPPEMQKDAIGTRLIHRFSKPQPKNHKVRRWTKENDPEGWAQFMEYCRQDVVAERWLHERLSPYNPPEWLWDEYHHDQCINDAGVPIDVDFVEKAISVSREEKKRLLTEMNKITGLSNSGSTDQMHEWLKEQNSDTDDLTKDTVAAELKRKDLPPVVREVFLLKQKHSKTSVTKFNAMKRAVCSNGRLHGMFQWGAASRTLRWAGRIVQLQNLANPTISDPFLAVALVKRLGADGLRMFFDVMSALSSTIRAAICAPPGTMILSPDLSSIESRLVGWLTGCTAIIETFANGLDTYKMYATKMYRVPYDQVTKKQRKNSKPPVLGGPYGLGADGLVAYAEGYGVEMTKEEAQQHTDTLRSTWHEIPTFWRWILDAVFKCTETGAETRGYRLRIYPHGEFLRIELPSGRSLSYHKPKIIKELPPWAEDIGDGLAKVNPGTEREKIVPIAEAMNESFSFMGKYKGSNKWGRITAHGGFLLENVVQAIARDIMAIWMQRVRENVPEATIIGSVHDEMMALAPEHEAEEVMQRMIEQARIPIPWASDLLLDADGEGFPSKRFRK